MNFARSLEFLVTRSREVVGAAKIIGWWELRRIPYNILVGLAGLMTCAASLFLAWISQSLVGEPVGLPDPPAVVPLFIGLYAFLANVLYTAGWCVELLFTRWFRRDLSIYAQAAFVVGTVFSVFLTLLPAILLGLIVIFVIPWRH
jgi:hypothetical protein